MTRRSGSTTSMTYRRTIYRRNLIKLGGEEPIQADTGQREGYLHPRVDCRRLTVAGVRAVPSRPARAPPRVVVPLPRSTPSRACMASRCLTCRRFWGGGGAPGPLRGAGARPDCDRA